MKLYIRPQQKWRPPRWSNGIWLPFRHTVLKLLPSVAASLTFSASYRSMNGGTQITFSARSQRSCRFNRVRECNWQIKHTATLRYSGIFHQTSRKYNAWLISLRIFKRQSCLVELKSKCLIRLYVVGFVGISISSDQLLAFSRSAQAWKISSLGNAWNDNWNLHPLMKLSTVLKSVINEKVVCLLWILLFSSPPVAQACQKFAPTALRLLWRPVCDELVASG